MIWQSNEWIQTGRDPVGACNADVCTLLFQLVVCADKMSVSLLLASSSSRADLTAN